MEVKINEASLAQLMEFCDATGLDHTDIKGAGREAKLRARIQQSGLAAAGVIEVEDPEPAQPAPVRAAAPAPREDPDEELPPRVFEMVASAIFTKVSSKTEGELTIVHFHLGVPVDQKEAMRLAVAHRNATRADPRNPFRGKAHGDKVTLLIPIEDRDGGDLPVFAVVNGREYGVKRGEPVELPWEVACAIANAKGNAMRRVDNASAVAVTKTGEVNTYPFQVVA